MVSVYACAVFETQILRVHFPRRYIPVARVCGDVRHAPLPLVLGGRTSSGAEPTILHFAQRRVLDATQGKRPLESHAGGP